MTRTTLLALASVLLGCRGEDVAAPEETPSETPVETPDRGSLRIIQLDLPGRSIGESALILTPTGQSVLIDVGSSLHASAVREVLAAEGVERVDLVVLTHEDFDHVGGFAGLFEGADALAYGAVLRQGDAVPFSMDLGGGTLDIFLADGRLATVDGVVNLWDEVTLDDSDNPRSLAGVVTWGDFQYLFAGDLTGGGKDTPDVESAVARRASVLPMVPANGVDVMHVSHHGISSSTNEAWTAWLRPTVAVVGANRVYLDAPSPEVLSSLAPYVQRVWVTETGLLGNTDERTRVANGPVEIVVGPDGNYTVQGESYAVR